MEEKASVLKEKAGNKEKNQVGTTGSQPAAVDGNDGRNGSDAAEGVENWKNHSSPWFLAHGFLPALAVSAGAGVLLAFTLPWQFIIVAGVIGGLVFIKQKASIAWWAGFLGTVIAWLVPLVYFTSTQPALETADLLMEIIAGSGGLGWVAVVLTLGVAGVIGGLGGLIGFSARRFIVKG